MQVAASQKRLQNKLTVNRDELNRKQKEPLPYSYLQDQSIWAGDERAARPRRAAFPLREPGSAPSALHPGPPRSAPPGPPRGRGSAWRSWATAALGGWEAVEGLLPALLSGGAGKQLKPDARSIFHSLWSLQSGLSPRQR